MIHSYKRVQTCVISFLPAWNILQWWSYNFVFFKAACFAHYILREMQSQCFSQQLDKVPPRVYVDIGVFGLFMEVSGIRIHTNLFTNHSGPLKRCMWML